MKTAQTGGRKAAAPSRLSSMKARHLLPDQDQREIALHYFIGVLCVLACLAALVVRSSDRAAGGWSRDIRAEITVQVRPSGLETGSVAAARAAEVLAGVKGVGQVTA
ncbi:MAG: ABC transporter permease, partial [Asticcacaulis sp.]|nr:ABC transporter permease [Asticcacaulis sp.]